MLFHCLLIVLKTEKMEIDKKNNPEEKSGGLMPVIIISSALIGILIVLKIIMG